MGDSVQIKVPDIGDFDEVEVIEVLVNVGDHVEIEQSLITVESDKASMEIPADVAGQVEQISVKVGDQVKQGSVIMMIAASAAAPAPTVDAPAPEAVAQPAAASEPTPSATVPAPPPIAAQPAPAPQPATPGPHEIVTRVAPVTHEPGDINRIVKPHASPSVRAFARELGVDLAQVAGSGPKQRIVREDVAGHVKGVMAGGGKVGASTTGGGGLDLLAWPEVDFEKFGAVQSQKLSRIKRVGAANLHRNWVMIPHVTSCEDADVTEIERFREQLNKENEKAGVKVTMLAFIVKACVSALKKFPEFNSSLDGENIVMKEYFNIGVAADTPNGLVVPVIKDADQKGVLQIAQEMRELAGRAREGKLKPDEMQGGTFSISSLGGIGGTYFTPIINAPEVAILGVCRAEMKPVWDGSEFGPRLILPMSLSWDHRVIDGAAAARFNAYLAQLLADFRRTML